MIGMLVLLTVGWVVMAVRSALEHSARAPIYWAMLSVGATLFVLVVVGVVVYLTLSIKAINLSRRQSNFIDSVTHELKSPLASLKLYLQTLARHQPSEEERRRFYRSMLDDVDRLDQLINHVLDAARLEKPSANGAKEAVQLDALISRCAGEVCQRHHVPTTTIQLNTVSCQVVGWRVDLELIFRNLLDNAIKYAGSPPEVIVNMRRTATGQVSVCISDNGRGIPHKFRQKVFGRFVRLGTELEREQQGLGLGLYIVRTLVARLRGRVRVRGREAAHGTTMEVLLPGTLPPQVSTPIANSSETVK
jgi:signal transduction histidine kinase